ncbi:MAG: hypothetical protein U0270_13020 [Labilithrix sp.]
MRWQVLVVLGVVAACSSDNDAPAAPSGATKNGPDASAPGSSSSSSGAADRPDGGPASRFVDTCALAAATCSPATVGEGSGLAEIDRCAYALNESAEIAVTPDVVTKLGTIAAPVTVTDVLNDANRIATKTATVPGAPSSVQYALNWQDDDNGSVAWTPQGLSGSADASDDGKVGGKTAVLVSFYDEPVAGSGEENVGVRIAFVDTTNAAAPRYRFALLVQPKAGAGGAPSFDPIKIHAGGMVWYRDWLYVADTTHGFRVFDMRRLLRVATDAGPFGCDGTACRAGNYKYVLPQIGKYERESACGPLFSWVSLDRRSDPPALVSGEYCSTDACAGPLAGRVFRWPLDPTTGLLRSAVTFPTEAYLMSHKQVQGGASVNGLYFLSSSAPSGDGGDLYRVTKGKSATSQWGDNPEDLMVDPGNGWLWSLNEKAGKRAVFAVKLDAYPAPL